MPFNLGTKTSNPDWTWDEDVLALELYFRRGLDQALGLPGASDSDVQSLSDLLRGLPLHREHGSNFRNPDGVARKLSNLRAAQIPGTGSVNNSETDRRVWAAFHRRRAELGELAAAIRRLMHHIKPVDLDRLDRTGDPEPYGWILLAAHRKREAIDRVVQHKIAAIEEGGRLRCEVCRFDFVEVYGDLGRGYIQAHDVVPPAQIQSVSRFGMADVALMCANCHEMVHRRSPWLSVSELAEAYRQNAGRA